WNSTWPEQLFWTPARNPNFAVHDFMNSVLHHGPSANPQTMNRYFRQARRDTEQQIFTRGDIAIPSSAGTKAARLLPHLRAYLTGLIRFGPDFVKGYNAELPWSQCGRLRRGVV
ncbi:hypothetical protein AAVH_22064, partial [Aphelenchoides avenae]